jgi:hypothetical protein
MTKDQVILLTKTLLTAIGSFFLGKSLFGGAITDNLLQTIVSGVVVVGSVVWSFFDGSIAVEGIQGALKQIVAAIGGVLASLGKSTASFDAISGALLPIIVLVYGLLSQKKSANIASGAVAIADLKGVSTQQAITPSLRVAGSPIQTVNAVKTETVVAASPATPVNTTPNTNTPVK